MVPGKSMCTLCCLYKHFKGLFIYSAILPGCWIKDTPTITLHNKRIIDIYIYIVNSSMVRVPKRWMIRVSWMMHNTHVILNYILEKIIYLLNIL